MGYVCAPGPATGLPRSPHLSCMLLLLCMIPDHTCMQAQTGFGHDPRPHMHAHGHGEGDDPRPLPRPHLHASARKGWAGSTDS